ncbi:phosphotransferase [Simiduia curdlanivorans]|uniref:Serine/threonine protein kinase n=1 Tax=Simiduia curdlanivorans TaxID=1492769 RepID=A0ABV8V5Z0_9GAMM|nr:phosphotransferase [Simiduia curdlanivorans]MDN3638653.1 phosphotransferase [Simiduia curdlanivorans]
MEHEHLQHFYINEEQSIYLLSQRDAKKLKSWLSLCEAQLRRLGYTGVTMIGKGAYGFVFAGRDSSNRDFVFKFSRITLPQHVQDRLEDEGYMLSQVNIPGVPAFVEFQKVHGQSILMMERAPGVNLDDYARRTGRLAPRLILKIAAQLADILQQLRSYAEEHHQAPIVHGDIKPSNLMWDESTEQLRLIDWGAAVYAQLDALGQHASQGGLSALSSDLQQTNAKLGDIYFIGEEQLNGGLSSPRFDEQGAAGSLYALASGQSSRFGQQVITPTSLGLPREFARTLTHLLSSDKVLRDKAGDYFLKNMRHMKNIVTSRNLDVSNNDDVALLPITSYPKQHEVDTVVYSSRKSFLRREMDDERFSSIDPTELDKYYKNFLSGMGDTEKGFVTAVSHLGRYPLVGGLAIHWDELGIHIDSSLNLYDEHLLPAFTSAVNNMVHLGRAINKQGVFKSCIFDARKTLHIERKSENEAFVVKPGQTITFDILPATQNQDQSSRSHSYFEDGDDPDEMLELPPEIMVPITEMNQIHHSGCIIFESLEKHLKIHNYLRLRDPSQEEDLKRCLGTILDNVHHIKGLGVSGFMKLPYRDTKVFPHLSTQPDRFCDYGL